MIMALRDRPTRRRGQINPKRRRTLTVNELANLKRSNRRLPAVLRAELPEITPELLLELGPRPTRRSQCRHGPRPCPWVGCRYHLFLEESTTKRPGLVFNWPDREPWELPDTCSLDACRDSKTLEEVGALLNLTRERIRQVEVVALLKVKVAMEESHQQLQAAWEEFYRWE